MSHRVLKTGCRVEHIQFKSGGALLNALAVYLVIAWRILHLAQLGRRAPESGPFRTRSFGARG